MISERFLLQQFLTGDELRDHHSSHLLNMTQQLMRVRVTVTAGLYVSYFYSA